MKWIYVAITAVLLTGCYSTRGLYDPNLTSTDPYVFVYPDSREDAVKTVKQVLYRNGWEIGVDDEGFLMTKQRDLPDDEYINTKSYMFGMTGARQSWIRGSLRFEFDDGQVTMTSTVIQDQTGEQPQSQGMPIMLKYRNLLEAEGFRLIDESAAEYTR